MIAAFIDLQGTLGGSGTDDIRSLEFYPFAIPTIKKLNDNGILVIGITNQSRISKGYLTIAEYEVKLQQLKDELANHDAHFDAVYCCPHTRADDCDCKKPKTGMINQALQEFNIDVKNSFVIGDMGKTDMVLANKIGAKGILVLTGVGQGSMIEYRSTWKDVELDYVAENVLDAVDYLLSTVAKNY